MASHTTTTGSRNGEPRASNHATITASRNGEPPDGHDEAERQKRDTPDTCRFDIINRLFHKLRATSGRATVAGRNKGRNSPATALAPAPRLHRLPRYVQRYRIYPYANSAAISTTALTSRSHTGNRRPHRQSKPRQRIGCHALKSKRTETQIYRSTPSGRRLGASRLPPTTYAAQLTHQSHTGDAAAAMAKLQSILRLPCQSCETRCGAYALKHYERRCGCFSEAMTYAAALTHQSST